MRLTWAFDPSEQQAEQVQKMFSLIRFFTKTSKDVRVAHVFGRTAPEYFATFASPIPIDLVGDPRAEIEQILKKAKTGIGPKSIELLDIPQFSLTAGVDKLVASARRNKSELIALYTQSRKGFLRFMMGSFAETAVHRSPLSMLLLNPKSKWRGRIRTVCFLDDFQPKSRLHLKKVIKLCKENKAKLVVFHSPELIYSWSINDSIPRVQRYREKVNKMRDEVLELCKKAGVAGEVILDAGNKPVAELALKAAHKRKADLLVTVAKLGPLASLIGGSVTRQVIRESDMPVLVLK